MTRGGTRLAAGGALLVLGACVPLFVDNPVYLDLAVFMAYYMVLAGSWNLLAGFTGEYSFAHAALAAVGAYGAVLVQETLGASPMASLPLAALLTAAVGLLLGLFALRVRGVYLSLVTFAFAGAFAVMVSGATSLTGGNNGHTSGFLFMGIDKSPYVWLGLGIVALYFILQSLVLDSRWGLFAQAVRDNEQVAAGLGVQTVRVKLVAFVYTAFWAGLAGALYAGYVGLVSPSISDLTEMGMIMSFVVVGGLGWRLGPILGVLVLQYISFQARGIGAEYTLMIFAAVALAVIVFVPNGLAGAATTALRRLRGGSRRWADETAAPSEPPAMRVLVRNKGD